MIITDDFVYIHMPKTGGTFTTEVLREVYEPVGRGPASALLGRTSAGSTPRAFLNTNKHSTCREIPPPHRNKPILATVRNPYDRWVSLYEFGWWRRHPPCDIQHIVDAYPHFPDLSFEEYVDLWNSIVLPMKTEDVDVSIQESFGLQTWQFVNFFFREPSEALTSIDLYYDAHREYRADMFDIHFIRTDRLNEELFDFLLSVGHARREVEFVLSLDKIYPDGHGRSRPTWDAYYTPALKSRVRTEEALIFRIFPEFDV